MPINIVLHYIDVVKTDLSGKSISLKKAMKGALKHMPHVILPFSNAKKSGIAIKVSHRGALASKANN